jgi:ABC-2 type transport system permease protein
MPIYEQSYRRHEARAPLRSVRFWPITREALRLILVKRAFLGLLAMGWLPFIGFTIFVYAVTQFPQAERVLPIDGELFARFFQFQMPMVFLLTTFGGAGLIANDLRTGAILVYLSRPLSRRDYVLGKLCVLLGLNLSVTLAPGWLLYGVALALAPEHFLKWSLVGLGPSIAAYSLLLALVLSLLALAISALSRSARVAGLVFFGLFPVLEIVRALVWAMSRVDMVSLLSLQADLMAIGNVLFGVRHDSLGVHWGYAVLVLLLTGVGCLAVLRSRVRAVEIVK